MLFGLFVLQQLLLPTGQNTGAIIEAPVHTSDDGENDMQPPSNRPRQSPTKGKENHDQEMKKTHTFCSDPPPHGLTMGSGFRVAISMHTMQDPCMIIPSPFLPRFHRSSANRPEHPFSE